MITTFYRDFYGCFATVTERRDGTAHLVMKLGNNGKIFHSKTYKSVRGAKIAMGRMSDGWRQL